jgi:hypothetical protein
LHLLSPRLDQVLFHLEVGNAVAEQPADPVRLLEHRHGVPGARQLLGAGEPRRSRADHRDALTGAMQRRTRHDPPLTPAAVGDRALDRFDRHRLLDEVEGACRFARGGADPAGELGKVVRRVEVGQRLAPVRLVHEVVPVGDHVVHRAAVVAVRNAAVHAPRGLALDRAVVMGDDELAPVLEAFLDGRVTAVLPLDFKKSCFLAHALRS